MGQVSYQLKRKIWSLNKTYHILDQSGQAVFQIIGKAFRIVCEISVERGRSRFSLSQGVKNAYSELYKCIYNEDFKRKMQAKSDSYFERDP